MPGGPVPGGPVPVPPMVWFWWPGGPVPVAVPVPVPVPAPVPVPVSFGGPVPVPVPVPVPARSRWPGPSPNKADHYAVWPASSNLFQQNGGSTLFPKRLVGGKQYCEVGTIIEQKQEPNGCQSQLLDMKTLDVASWAAVSVCSRNTNVTMVWGMDVFVIVCSRNTNVTMVWAWMLWWPSALGTPSSLWLRQRCFRNRMLQEYERYYGCVMDALVTVCSRNTNVIRVLAWMLS